jgi:hypothetical protein
MDSSCSITATKTQSEQPKYSCDFALTITLKPQIYRETAEEQYRQTAYNVAKLFSKCKLTLIAELTQSCNIHYHGIIAVPITISSQPRKYIFDQIRKYSKLGKTTVVQMTNYEGWSDYLSKDLQETSKTVYPIIKDDYEIA